MTTKELVEKLNNLIEKHPTLANVQVVDESMLSIECVEVDSEGDEVVVIIE